jgi:uncharacterized protein
VSVVNAEPGKVDLDALGLSSGQAEQVELEVSIEPIRLGDQVYAVEGGKGAARVDVSRTTSGYALRLRLPVALDGPCVRCLEPSSQRLEIDVREVEQPATGDEEMRSPYVEEGVLDVAHWANDAVVLALPAKPLCREDCAGLCPVCGESLNDADPEAHKHPSGGDPRMAKLRDLKLD